MFYVIPTSGADWVDGDGVTHHFLDINNPDHRLAMEDRFNMAYPIFGDSANFFSPYYRQITLQVWAGGTEAVNQYYPTTFEDVKADFDYYMEHWNGGREFVLAGFSQGVKGVKELMKVMTEEQYARMKAAYVIGFPVLQEDVDATDRFKPANWSTGTEVAQVNDTVTNYINKEHMMLFVDGVDSEKIFQPETAELFPLGNYHLLELPLYAKYLRENVKLRLYGK